ncbi:hypothetical protein EVAR_28099_1 [Eumeta japonica]|uniref:Uncharacterized protein n=1 Tax=Eumeta variegata TaxID=151549 RepID=A0A4C1W8J2_EUMVA|nr:hypothetical protein EVAR_28099_1 [Eumeta japonica]
MGRLDPSDTALSEYSREVSAKAVAFCPTGAPSRFWRTTFSRRTSVRPRTRTLPCRIMPADRCRFLHARDTSRRRATERTPLFTNTTRGRQKKTLYNPST